MARHRQHKQDSSPLPSGRGGQTIVRLCGASASGIVFRSRHKFDLAAELQLRIRGDTLPPQFAERLHADAAGWVTIRGFVVECLAVRQPDGAASFEVSVVLEAFLAEAAARQAMHKPVAVSPAARGTKRSGFNFGLN